MTADEILHQCIATLTQRGKQYDPGQKHERSAVDAAEIFNEVFLPDGELRISSRQVWQIMLSVKLARLRTVKDPSVFADTIIDIINYFALLGEELTSPAV